MPENDGLPTISSCFRARIRQSAAVLVVGLAVSSGAHAKQCLLITLPAARENGATLAATELDTLQIKYTRTIATGTEQGSRDLALKTTHCFNFSTPGTYQFSVAVTDKNKVQSAFSNVVTIELVKQTTAGAP